jgi:hypothetical protein
MSRKAIRDSRYRIIGYIETAPDGKQKATNAQYRIVGYFDPARNETKDCQYRIVGRGNVLASLFVRCS